MDAPLTQAPNCLNCSAPLTGEYCATCGQRAVDLAAPTWHLAREAFADATDLDGRLLRTARAIGSPGRLTLEFLRGRRTPYVGPFKLFLFVGAALSTSWVVTRGIDARYYGMSADQSAGTYIDTVVRGLLTGCVAVALTSWALAGRRRRLSDETVFALHLTTALAVWFTIVTWLGAAWKVAWGTSDRVPSSIPPLPVILFLPAAVMGLVYAAAAIRRVHGVAWWMASLRAIALAVVGFAAVTAVLFLRFR